MLSNVNGTAVVQVGNEIMTTNEKRNWNQTGNFRDKNRQIYDFLETISTIRIFFVCHKHCCSDDIDLGFFGSFSLGSFHFLTF